MTEKKKILDLIILTRESRDIGHEIGMRWGYITVKEK